jgi:hypothetical protein
LNPLNIALTARPRRPATCGCAWPPLLPAPDSMRAAAPLLLLLLRLLRLLLLHAVIGVQ